MAAAGCPRVPLRCHPGLGRVPAGPRAAGSPAPDRRPPGAANRTRRERAGGAVRAVRIRAGAAACAHPGQVRPAARPLRIPVPVLTGLEGHAGRTAEPTRARQRLVSDPGLLRPRCLAGTPSALPVPPLLATLRNKSSSGETRTLPPFCTGGGPFGAGRRLAHIRSHLRTPTWASRTYVSRARKSPWTVWAVLPAPALTRRR